MFPKGLKWPGFLGIFFSILFYFFLFIPRSEAWEFFPKEGRLVYPKIDAAGFLSDERFKGTGRIASAKNEQSILLGQNDHVYLDIGSADGVKIGDLLTVFRTVYLGHKEGEYAVHLLGLIEVIEMDDVKSEARIVEAYRSITIGDRVVPYKRRSPEITLERNPNRIEGRILMPEQGETIIGSGNVVYIDRGRTDGVKRGNCFTIYRQPEGHFRKSAGEPLVNKVGELVVVVPQRVPRFN